MKTVKLVLPKNLCIENTSVNEIEADSREFSTGSVGFYVGGLKLVDKDTGKRYQTQFQAIEIGTSDKAKEKAATKAKAPKKGAKSKDPAAPSA